MTEQTDIHKIVDNYLFFYKNKTPFSQWTRYNIFEAGIMFTCCEQKMMYEKALLFKDTETANKILRAIYPSEHKDLGRKVKGFDETTWLYHREEIVYQANLLKFSQYPHLTQFILDTEDKILVEASPDDGIWGIKMSIDDPNLMNTSKWGLNLLGKALMQVRSTLRYGREQLG